jgi:6,7-dimethyl-8-ribityllumazine synthase
MKTSITINYPNLSADEADKVITFFEAIGLDHRGGNPGRKNSALLSVPIGAVGINMLPAVSACQVGHRLSVGINNPDVIFDLARKFNFKVLRDSAHPESDARSFSIELPGGITLDVVGGPLDPPYGIDGKLDAKGRRFAIVVSRFNAFITERLLHGALDALRRAGAGRTIVRVPGSFEIPSVARTLAETQKYDAIICLGCLLRGDTAHYDVIANEVTRGIGQSAQETGVPHAFGVLTCDTLEQAIDRAGLKMGNKGFEAALAAVEMANLKKAVSRQPSAVRKTVVHRPSSVVRQTAVSRQPSAVRKNKNRTSKSPKKVLSAKKRKL